jgi:hypothetical protein
MITIDNAFRAALLAAAVFGCASGAAYAAADKQAAWVGLMENLSATATCASLGVGGSGVGDLHVSVYRPHIVSTDTTTYLAIVFTPTEFTLANTSETTNPQMNGSGTDTTTLIDGRGKPVTYAGSYSLISVTPNPVTETTPIITITGTINNYFNFTGCNVSFHAVYEQKEK